MKQILIENELHFEFKKYAVEQKTSMKNILEGMIKQKISQ